MKDALSKLSALKSGFLDCASIYRSEPRAKEPGSRAVYDRTLGALPSYRYRCSERERTSFRTAGTWQSS